MPLPGSFYYKMFLYFTIVKLRNYRSVTCLHFNIIFPLHRYHYQLNKFFSFTLLVSFAAVIRVVTLRSSPLTAAHSSSAFLSLCYWEPITCLYLLAAAPIIFLVIFPPKTSFQKMKACSLLVNLRERNVELEWAAVSGEDRCVTTLITAAKETITL